MSRLLPNDGQSDHRVQVGGEVVSSVRVLVGVDGVDYLDDNVDVEVELADQGWVSYLFVTAKNLSTLLARWQDSGELGRPAFWKPENAVFVADLRAETIVSVVCRLSADVGGAGRDDQ